MAERLTFDRSLYSPEAVEAAVRAYSEHAKIDVNPSGDGVETVIHEAGEYDVATIAHAFANHVLYETIALRRQSAIDEGA